MREPTSREIYACRTCHDFKRVYADRATVECPECKAWPQEKREDLLRNATRERAEKPSIRASDLTDEERAIVAQWRIDHPLVHELTLLTWIEGRRYDPEKDPEFLAEARKRFKKWQFLRNSNEGPISGWAQHALLTGDVSGLSKTDREYVDSLKEAK
jgi:hypothetical protein